VLQHELSILHRQVRQPRLKPHDRLLLAAVSLDRMLIVGRRQLEYVLHIYIPHYNRRRPHRALGLHPPDTTTAPPPITTPHPHQIKRHELLGDLIHEYELAAA
jgi:hypothetical protein